MDFNIGQDKPFTDNNNNISNQSNSGTVSLHKKEQLEESNILAWIEKYYEGTDLTTIKLEPVFGEEWILEEKGDKAYLSRQVTWKLKIGGNTHVLEQKLKTSVEYPSGGALEQEKALHRANFCIRLYTETLMLPVNGIDKQGFKADELAKATLLRFDFGQNQVFSKHTVVKVYNPSKGPSQPNYCLSVKLGDDIESVFQDSVGTRIVGTDEVERRSGFKARKILNQNEEIILHHKKDNSNEYEVSDQECIEVRELLSEKMRNARFEIKNADYILNKEPEKGFKGFFNSAKENVKELFGLSDLDKKPLMERLEQVQNKIGKVGQDITRIKEKIQQKRLELRNTDRGNTEKRNSLNNQIRSLREEGNALVEQSKSLKDLRDELMGTAEKVLHQMQENHAVYETNSDKVLRVAVDSLYRIALEIVKAKNEGKNPDDEDYYYTSYEAGDESLNNMNDQQRYNALLTELKKEELLNDFNEAQKNDPSIRHILELVENTERFQVQQDVMVQKAESRINQLKNLEADEVLYEVLDEELLEEEESDLNEEGPNEIKEIKELSLDEFSDEYTLELDKDLENLNIDEEKKDPLQEMKKLEEKVLNLDDLKDDDE